MRSALFWGITQRRGVILYRRFGTTYRSHLHGTRSPRIFLDLLSPRRFLDFKPPEDGTDTLSRHVSIGLLDLWRWDQYVVPKRRYSWTSWPLKMGTVRCPETSVKDYHSTLRSTSQKSANLVNIAMEASNHGLVIKFSRDLLPLSVSVSWRCPSAPGQYLSLEGYNLKCSRHTRPSISHASWKCDCGSPVYLLLARKLPPAAVTVPRLLALCRIAHWPKALNGNPTTYYSPNKPAFKRCRNICVLIVNNECKQHLPMNTFSFPLSGWFS
jgi:hypothetical protein